MMDNDLQPCHSSALVSRGAAGFSGHGGTVTAFPAVFRPDRCRPTAARVSTGFHHPPRQEQPHHVDVRKTARQRHAAPPGSAHPRSAGHPPRPPAPHARRLQRLVDAVQSPRCPMPAAATARRCVGSTLRVCAISSRTSRGRCGRTARSIRSRRSSYPSSSFTFEGGIGTNTALVQHARFHHPPQRRGRIGNRLPPFAAKVPPSRPATPVILKSRIIRFVAL